MNAIMNVAAMNANGSGTALTSKQPSTSTPVGIFAQDGSLLSSSMQSGGFMLMLQQALTNEGSQEMNQTLLPANILSLLSNTASGDGMVEETDVTIEAWASQMLEWVKANPELAEQALAQNDHMMAWINQAIPVLTELSNQTSVQPSSALQQLLAQIKHLESEKLTPQALQSMLNQWAKTQEQLPQMNELQMLTQQLKSAIHKDVEVTVHQLLQSKNASLGDQQRVMLTDLLNRLGFNVEGKTTENSAMPLQQRPSGEPVISNPTRMTALEMLQSKSTFYSTIQAVTQGSDAAATDTEMKPVQMLTQEGINVSTGETQKSMVDAQMVKSAAPQVPVQQFAQQFSEMLLKSLQFKQMLNGVSEAKISLIPQHLGQVDVRITMQNGQMVAQFVAETMIGKEALDSQLNQLRATLQSQGIQVEKLEVTHHSASESMMFQEHRQKQQSFNQSNGGQQKSSQDHQLTLEDFMLEFEEGLDGQSLVYGGSFHATA